MPFTHNQNTYYDGVNKGILPEKLSLKMSSFKLIMALILSLQSLLSRMKTQ